jgi:hypothetical protein
MKIHSFAVPFLPFIIRKVHYVNAREAKCQDIFLFFTVSPI